MGLYRRSWKRKDGTIVTSKTWWASAMVNGRQRCRTLGTSSKRLAQQIYDIWRAEITRGANDLVKRTTPKLKPWCEQYLETVRHPNTYRRYKSSKANLVYFFGDDVRLGHVTVTRIEEFKSARFAVGVKAATVNRDLRFLAQVLKQAERERYIARSPFDAARFFVNESRDRRKPHILSWEEEEMLLAVARPRIRALLVLGIETGMRTREMLGLRWRDIDFLNDVLQVGHSKTASGIRALPISVRCKTELMRWRNLIGPDFSEWVFPNFSNRRHALQGGRKAWASTLKQAGIPFFPIYYLRHTFASRLTAAGVSPITIAQLLGHASTQIVPRYAQVLDENRLDAIKKMETFRQSAVSDVTPLESKPQEEPSSTKPVS
jgi:integrase